MGVETGANTMEAQHYVMMHPTGKPVVDGMEPRDISSEMWREYMFHDLDAGKGYVYHINDPVTLYVKKSERGDSHRVVDSDGVAHYIPANWVAIRWKASPEVEF